MHILKRANLATIAFTTLSFALLPVFAFAEMVSTAHLQFQASEIHASYLAMKLRPDTAARILADDTKGHWWAQSADGPLAAEIKIGLHRGSSTDKENIRRMLRLATNPKIPYRPRVPVE